MSKQSLLSPALLRVLGAFVLCSLASTARAAPLSFTAALDRAEQLSPAVAAKTAQREAARATATSADALPDPKLFVGIDNLPVTGPDSGSLSRDFMTMQKIGVMQDVPNSDKRRARRDAATAAITLAEVERQAERLKVRSATAQAWIKRHSQEQREALFDELARENRLLVTAVRAQLAASSVQASDVVMAKQEAVQLADRRDELTRDLAKTKAALRRYVGTEADEPLAGDVPILDVDEGRLRQHLGHHPDLAAFEPMTQVAQAQLHEAEAAKQSDWGMQLGYQKRGPLFSDMVSVQLTFDLPIFTRTRQEPAIAARQQELLRIEAEREGMLRDHTAELDSALADYELLTRQLDRLNNDSLPLAQQKMDLQLAAYRTGKGNISPLLTARREWIELRMKRIDIEGQRAAVAAQLIYTYGAAQP